MTRCSLVITLLKKASITFFDDSDERVFKGGAFSR